MLILIVVTLSVMFFIGLTLLVLGMRGRIVDDHPYCRKCRFDLYERWPDVAVCPECGQKLGEGTIRIGCRVRSRWKLATGALMSAFVTMIVVSAVSGMYAQLAPYKPLVLLRADMRFGSASLAAAAVNELAARLQSGAVDDRTMQTLALELLDIQADHLRPWSPAFGDIIETARAANRIDDELWMRYVRQGVDVPILTRGMVRQGERVPIQFELSPIRYGSNINYPLRLSVPRIVEPGEQYESSGGWIGTSLQTQSAPGSTMTTAFPHDLPIGAQTVEYAMEVSVEFAGRKTSFIRREQTLLHVSAADKSLVSLINDDEQLAGAVRSAIRIENFRVSPTPSPNLQAMVVFGDLPVDVAFEVVLVSGEHRWTLPYAQVCARSGKPMSYGIHSNLSDLTGDVPFDLTEVDVLLEPSPRAAETTIDMMVIFGEPVLFKDVPVNWEQ